jgi:23S rRNA (adenine2030-N6)-methyltransferase
MNYRHAFHAGNFADVVKHIVLTRILLHLQDKPTAFRVIDTHAGAGRYDLTSVEAQRGGEWKSGIARLLSEKLDHKAAALIAPYLDIVRAFNPLLAASPAATEARVDNLAAYPGSPLIARALLRPQDRLVACEIEPDARAALIDALRRDTQARVVDLDGWTALKAFVPPKERRGLVLIDPPYEARDESDRLADTFAAAFTRWPTGIYLVWYPVKDPRAGITLARRLGEHASALLRLETSIASPSPNGPLTSAGLIVVNPPWKLADELRALMPAVTAALGQQSGQKSDQGPSKATFHLEHRAG